MPVVAGVPLEYELSDDDLVLPWLAAIVKDALGNIGLAEALSEEDLHKWAALSWCQMRTVKLLRARKANDPDRYLARLQALALNVLSAAYGCNKQELNEQQAMELEDLAHTITTQVDDKLAAKAAVQPPPAAAPVATTKEDEADGEAARVARVARAKELQKSTMTAHAKRALASAARRGDKGKLGEDSTPIYEGWSIEIEEREEKPKGAPRGKTALRTSEDVAEAKVVAAERRAAAAEEPTLKLRAVFRCNLCNGPPLASVSALAGHRNGAQSCTRRRVPKVPVPVDDQVQQTPPAKRGRNDDRYDRSGLRVPAHPATATASKKSKPPVALPNGGAVSDGDGDSEVGAQSSDGAAAGSSGGLLYGAMASQKLVQRQRLNQKKLQQAAHLAQPIGSIFKKLSNAAEPLAAPAAARAAATPQPPPAAPAAASPQPPPAAPAAASPQPPRAAPAAASPKSLPNKPAPAHPAAREPRCCPWSTTFSDAQLQAGVLVDPKKGGSLSPQARPGFACRAQENAREKCAHMSLHYSGPRSLLPPPRCCCCTPPRICTRAASPHHCSVWQVSKSHRL